MDLENILGYITESDQLLAQKLQEMQEPDLDKKFINYQEEKTRRTHLTGFHWHEAYHSGQVELLRTFILDRRP